MSELPSRFQQQCIKPAWRQAHYVSMPRLQGSCIVAEVQA